jgi:hypothetical protein
MSNQRQALVALGGFGLGLITIYLPTWLLLRHRPGLRRDDFLEAHPHKRPLILLYDIISFLTILLGPLSSLIVINGVPPSMRPFFFLCCWTNSIGLVNGLFEAVTGICPKRGINFRLAHKQIYLQHPSVRITGIVRIGLGILIVAAYLMWTKA